MVGAPGDHPKWDWEKRNVVSSDTIPNRGNQRDRQLSDTSRPIVPLSWRTSNRQADYFDSSHTVLVPPIGYKILER